MEAYQVQDYGFAVGQQVTWPMGRLRRSEDLTALVGEDVAGRVDMGPDWYARDAADTVTYAGIVTGIASYRCRYQRGRVVVGSVVTHPVTEAVFAGTVEENAGMDEGMEFVGYLVTLERTSMVNHQASGERGLGASSIPRPGARGGALPGAQARASPR